MSGTINIKVHRVAGYEPGAVVEVATDSEGTPLDRFWRRRLRDAQRDKCCEVQSPRRNRTRAATDEAEAEESEA